MDNSELTVWVIRSGGMNELNSLFLRQNFIALGNPEIGDLNKLPNDRAVFRAKIAILYPDKKPGAIPGVAGQLLRFSKEMAIEDIVIYQSKINQKIYIGQVVGAYRHDPSIDHLFPHLRPVKWHRVASRNYFSARALEEARSILAFFQIKRICE